MPPRTLGAFAAELAARIDRLATPVLSAEAAAFATRHGMDAADPALLRDYVRMKTLFEATRDGGFWRLRWAITNQMPTSKRIFEQWSKAPLASGGATAVAECDEISALTAGLAARLGVRGVGLFYPTWNHTIVAWEPASKVRVLVPTTQIFLACDAGFDATTFSPTAQKTVWAYGGGDLPSGAPIGEALSRALLDAVEAYAGASPRVLALLRLDRTSRMASSTGDCSGTRAALVRSVEGALSCADRAAIARYLRVERGLATDERSPELLLALRP